MASSLQGYSIVTAVIIGSLSVAGIVLGALGIAGVIPLAIGVLFLYGGLAALLEALGIIGLFDLEKTLPLALPCILLGLALTFVSVFAPSFAAVVTLLAASSFFVLVIILGVSIASAHADTAPALTAEELSSLSMDALKPSLEHQVAPMPVASSYAASPIKTTAEPDEYAELATSLPIMQARA